MDNNMNNYYNEIIMFLIEQKNMTIKHIDICGIIEYTKNIHNFDASKINDSIYYINFLYNNSEDLVQNKKFPLYEFYNVMNIIYNKFNDIYKEGIDLVYKILNCEYISKYEKYNIITYFNGLIDRNKYDIIEYTTT